VLLQAKEVDYERAAGSLWAWSKPHRGGLLRKPQDIPSIGHDRLDIIETDIHAEIE
jgi:hypothetical protein